MLIELVQFINTWVLEFNRDLDLQRGMYLGVQEDGKGVIAQEDMDWKYIGLSDQYGNYFYIRHQAGEEIEFADAEKKFASCQTNWLASTPLRLVCVIDQAHVNKYQIAESLYKTLETINFVHYDGEERRCRIQLQKIYLNLMANMKDENQKRRHVKPQYKVIAIDFILSFMTVNCNYMGCITFCSTAPGGNVPGALKIVQTLTLGAWNTLTHNLGADYEVYELSIKNSANQDMEMDEWEEVDDNSIRVFPVGAGTETDCQLFIQYRAV